MPSFMDYIPFELTLISANNLQDANHLSKMDVYAVVTIDGDPQPKQKSPIDGDCGSNPKWNHTMKFTIDKTAAHHNRLNFLIRLVSDRKVGNKDIGEVLIPIKELLENDEKCRSCTVRSPTGNPRGTLKLSYKIGENSAYSVSTPEIAEQSHVTKKGIFGQSQFTSYPPANYDAGYPYNHPPPPQPHVTEKGIFGNSHVTPYPPANHGAGYPYNYSPPPQPNVTEKGIFGNSHFTPYPPANYGVGHLYNYPPPPQYGYGAYGAHPPEAGYGYSSPGGYGLGIGGMGARVGMGLGVAGGLMGGMLIGHAAGDVVEGVSDCVTGISDGVFGIGEDIVGGAYDCVSGISNGVVGIGEDIVGGDYDCVSGIEDGFVGIGDNMVGGAYDYMNGVQDRMEYDVADDMYGF